MEVVLRTLVAMWLFVGCIQTTFGQTSDRESFDTKLYSVVPLRHFGTGPKQFAGLSAHDKASLLACRDVLTALFQGVDRNIDVSRYLTSELARKYGNGTSLLDPETSLMEVGIFDWSVPDDGNRIELHFLTLAFSEGDWVLSKNVAILSRSGSEWRVTQFRWKEK